jgi:hypothetical protein
MRVAGTGIGSPAVLVADAVAIIDAKVTGSDRQDWAGDPRAAVRAARAAEVRVALRRGRCRYGRPDLQGLSLLLQTNLGGPVKLGLGLYRHMLTEDNLRFARQAGATHIVAHLVDYFAAAPRIPSSVSRDAGGGPTHRVGKPWTLQEIEEIKGRVEAVGMTKILAGYGRFGLGWSWLRYAG